MSAAALAAALVMTLAGCMRLHLDLTLGEDDTMDGSIVVAISDDVAQTLGQDPQDLWDQMGSEIDGNLPDGAEQEPYAEDGYTGARFTYADQPISDTGTGDELTITRDGDEYVVSGTFDLSEGADDAGQLPKELLDSFDVRLAVTFPGKIAETNGKVDGTTAVWTPTYGEALEMSARGSAVADGTAPSASDPATPGGADGSDLSDDGDGVTGTSAADDGGLHGWALFWAVAGSLLLVAAVVTLLVRLARRGGPGGPGAAGPGSTEVDPTDPLAGFRDAPADAAPPSSPSSPPSPTQPPTYPPAPGSPEDGTRPPPR
ncbi:hypothetical protein [Cellulomonas sp. PhB143]|uniref:LppM family (lipo)protein n=1 Tax=Cellulomonas sp. PhB143 TaxID=2485186 RepID=UPI000F479712|nr:hypothetical protein [Cellulomonas sp. PhB143]ROS76474.1 hypothetical protein EDF32_1288 [Cellulomonas sp. PhB143]